MRLDEKVAIVTGGASGIGRAAAELLVSHGGRVVLADVDRTRGEQVAEQLGDRARFREVDVASSEDVEGLMKYAVETFGSLTTVVNNAGVQSAGRVDEMAEAEWDRMLGINPKSCFLTTRHAVPHLRRAGGGSIVNVASVAGIKANAGMTAYAASKGAIIAMTTALAAELAPDNIRVNCLCPGWIDTPFNEPAIANMGGRRQQDALVSSTVPMGRQGTPAEAAEAILFLVSDASSYMTSQRLVIDGGLT